VDLLSVREVRDALTAVHALIPAPTLVVHTKYWAAALGGDHTGALDNGTLMAAARYAHGDDFTDSDVERMRRTPRRPESVAFAAALRSDTVSSVPGFALDVADPTTVGLGDTFVGGFLAAIADSEGR
jgi:ADP-dependent phosphofructokinase/glucokinase